MAHKAAPHKESSRDFKPGAMLTIVALALAIAVVSFLLGSILTQQQEPAVTANVTPATTPTAPSPTTPRPNQTQTFDPAQSIAATRPQSSTPTTSAPPPVRLEPAEVDLGTVPMETKLPVDVKIYNTGDKPLKILSSRANCGCTAVDLADVVIPPGGSVPLNATFDTRKNIGPKNSQITIAFDGYDQQVRLPIRATVRNISG